MRIYEIFGPPIIVITSSGSVPVTEGIRDAQQAIRHGDLRYVCLSINPDPMAYVKRSLMCDGRYERETIGYRKQVDCIFNRSTEVSSSDHKTQDGRDRF